MCKWSYNTTYNFFLVAHFAGGLRFWDDDGREEYCLQEKLKWEKNYDFAKVKTANIQASPA